MTIEVTRITMRGTGTTSRYEITDAETGRHTVEQTPGLGWFLRKDGDTTPDAFARPRADVTEWDLVREFIADNFTPADEIRRGPDREDDAGPVILPAGRLRVSIVVDEYFNRMCPDFAEEIQADTVRALESGELEAYGVIVERLHCDRPEGDGRECLHDEHLGALWGVLEPSGRDGWYSLATLAERGTPHLAEIVMDIVNDAGGHVAVLDETDKAALEPLSELYYSDKPPF